MNNNSPVLTEEEEKTMLMGLDKNSPCKTFVAQKNGGYCRTHINPIDKGNIFCSVYVSTLL